MWIYKDLLGNLRQTMHKETFDSFAEYYKFLDGDIYENACYYQYPFTDEFSSKLKVDITRLKRTKSFVTESVDDYSYEISTDEIAEYDHCERTNKKLVKQWIDKFNACDTYDQFKSVCNNYEKSAIAQCKSIEFFFFQYAFDDLQNREHLGVIREYLSKDYIGGTNVVFGLCMIYAPEEILDKYDFSQASDITNKKRKRELKNFVESLNAQDVEVQKRGYFDKKTHFYCEKTELYCYVNIQGRRTLNQWPSVRMCRAFETFDEFISYKKGDLKNCDISGAFDLNVDFSKYMTDVTTKLPITKSDKIKYEVRKMYSKGEFAVGQFWYDEYGKCVKQQIHEFQYFFDFVAFLKGDLSGADLVFCTGLKNLTNVDGINLNGARMKSDVCEQLKIPFTTYEYEKELIAEFPIVEKNEIETSFVLQMKRETEPLANNFGGEINRISYISDLHLMHRIKNAECKSKEDVICVIQKIVDTILDESSRITLIGGDVASELSIFTLFVKLLRRSADRGQSGYERIFGKKIFIFILGNHELWKFPGVPLEEIVNQYRTILTQNEMFLLQNDLFYSNEFDDMGIIPYNELIQSENSVISEKLRCARLVVLGGLGFSGYNKEFNAKDGVYRETIDRNTEIQESKKFEELYDKITNILVRKNTIIFTHMPKRDWCADTEYCDNFVYVSGHTHRNMFFDDGAKRVYADNQIGYKNESPHLKSFLVDGEYDYFDDYEDGIYEISSQQYQDFFRGKNIRMTFNRQINVLYMLKKNGFYCFIHETKTGSLSMLNGGALKKTKHKGCEILLRQNG